MRWWSARRSFRHPWLQGWGASLDGQIHEVMKKLEKSLENTRHAEYARELIRVLQVTSGKSVCAEEGEMKAHIEAVQRLFRLRPSEEISIKCFDHAELILVAKGCISQLAFIYFILIQEAKTIFSYIDYWSSLSTFKHYIMSRPFTWRSVGLKRKIRRLAQHQTRILGMLGRVGDILSNLDLMRRVQASNSAQAKKLPFQLRTPSSDIDTLLVTIVESTIRFVPEILNGVPRSATTRDSAEAVALSSKGVLVRRTAALQASHFFESLRHHALEFESSMSLLRKPPLWQRRWLEITLSVSLATYVSYWAMTTRTPDNECTVFEDFLQRMNRTRREFVFEHITEPVKSLWDEVVMNKPFDVVDHQEVVQSKRSFEIMLRDYILSVRPGVTDDEIDILLESGQALEILARNYEQEVKSPMSSVVRGSIVQMLLIQIQALKKELLKAMEKVDISLKSNHKNIEIMATAPAIMLGACTYYSFRFAYRKLFRRHSRSQMTAESWVILLDIEQALNLTLGSVVEDMQYVNVMKRAYVSSPNLLVTPVKRHDVSSSTRGGDIDERPPPPPIIGRCPSWDEAGFASSDEPPFVVGTPPDRRPTMSHRDSEMSKFHGMSKHCFGEYLLNIERLVFLVNKHISYVPNEEVWRLRRDLAELLRADATPQQKINTVSRIQRLAFFER